MALALAASPGVWAQAVVLPRPADDVPRDLERARVAYDGIPDHVGHELELYGRLLEAEHTAEVRGDGDRAARLRNSQRILLTEQLEAWVPAFCDKVVKRAELPFYAAVARLTKDLLTAERERLGA